MAIASSRADEDTTSWAFCSASVTAPALAEAGATAAPDDTPDEKS